MEQTVIVEEVRSHLSDEKVKKAIELQSYIRGYLGGFFRTRGFIEVPPVPLPQTPFSSFHLRVYLKACPLPLTFPAP